MPISISKVNINTKVWILTSEYNDYDQHGEYFITAFKDKPNIEQLVKFKMSEIEAQHVQNSGGRIANEDHWFYLRQEDLQ